LINSEGERGAGALGSRETKGEEKGEDVSLPTRLGIWKSIVSFPAGSGRRRFYCNLICPDRLCIDRQQITADSSPFHSEKWRYGTPVQKVGVSVPFVNCANGLIVAVDTELMKSESDAEVRYLLTWSAYRLLSSCGVAVSWCSKYSTEGAMSTTVRDTLAVCLADLPVCRTIHLRLADITSLWVRTPLSVARPDETPRT